MSRELSNQLVIEVLAEHKAKKLPGGYTNVVAAQFAEQTYQARFKEYAHFGLVEVSVLDGINAALHRPFKTPRSFLGHITSTMDRLSNEGSLRVVPVEERRGLDCSQPEFVLADSLPKLAVPLPEELEKLLAS